MLVMDTAVFWLLVGVVHHGRLRIVREGSTLVRQRHVGRYMVRSCDCIVGNVALITREELRALTFIALEATVVVIVVRGLI